MATAAVSQVTDLLASKLHLSPGESLTPTPPKQPDISYHPDETNYKERAARRLAEDPTLPKRALPEGFPKKLESPLVWEGKDWTNPEQWEFTLTDEHLKEINDAVKHFKGLDNPLGYLSPETFPLPTLSPELKKLSEELHNGRGFFVLRTIPVDSYTREENVIIYAGVSSHIASRRGVQDAGDIVLAHIKDLTQTHPAKTIGAPAYTQDKQVFHTDIGDIISLYVLETAKEGGTSRISSSWRVYNELAETRPDLIGTLAEEWTLDGFGANPPYSRRTLLQYHDERIIIQYARRIFTGFLGLPRSTDIPPITEAQAEALDAVHYIAEKYALGLSFQKGDIQYINNLSIFHGRDGYTDDEEKKRHLLRLWLRNDELAWKLPEQYDGIWKRLYYSATPDSETFPLDPDILTRSKGGAAYSYTNPLPSTCHASNYLEVTADRLSQYKIPIPSDILADVLLRANPGASAVSVCTQDWGAYYTDSVEHISEFVEAVLSANNICEDDGLIYLQQKPQHPVSTAAKLLPQPVISKLSDEAIGDSDKQSRTETRTPGQFISSPIDHRQKKGASVRSDNAIVAGSAGPSVSAGLPTNSELEDLHQANHAELEHLHQANYAELDNLHHANYVELRDRGTADYDELQALQQGNYFAEHEADVAELTARQEARFAEIKIRQEAGVAEVMARQEANVAEITARQDANVAEVTAQQEARLKARRRAELTQREAPPGSSPLFAPQPAYHQFQMGGQTSPRTPRTSTPLWLNPLSRGTA